MKPARLFFYLYLVLTTTICVHAQSIHVDEKLTGIDSTIHKILKDWNVPGCGVGIVLKDKLVFAKGYGYRDVENKLPITPNTLFQIASNTKLFTATAIGFLVEEGKLEWDKPIKKYVPQIEFYNHELNTNVTIRDMLSHRTGISRHDNIWIGSGFTRQQLFERLKYLEPSIPFRQGFLYNNLMYAASGQIVELLSGKTWEQYVTDKIFTPLNMVNSTFSVEEAKNKAEFALPYYEKRESSVLQPQPFFTSSQGIGPAGSIVSNLNDLSKWLIAQIHGGKYLDKQVIPQRVIKETLQPASLSATVPDKYFENLNSMYGMGRNTSSYKGHYRTEHGGSTGGIYSHITFLPADSIGIMVFSNAAHARPLPAMITNIIVDKLLDLEPTPWNEREWKEYLKMKAMNQEIRKKPDADRVLNTKPSHPLAEYIGKYEDAAYGVMEIQETGGNLQFAFNNKTLSLQHYHYDRFVSVDDEIHGKWSLLFGTDAQGAVQNIRVSLDEKEVVFSRKADAKLSNTAFLKNLEGTYESSGTTLHFVLSAGELVITSSPPQHLEPFKNSVFRIREFSDKTIEFIVDKADVPTGLLLTSGGKAVVFTKKK
jgi:CubicO group peptidase (beta-lactamase class C family)